MIHTETDKWNDRHFQICLALIMSRPTPSNGVSLSMRTIIDKADKMIALLQERENKLHQKMETTKRNHYEDI